MPDMIKPLIGRGFDPQERELVALLFWRAFGRKLHFAMRPKSKAQRFIRDVLNPDYALTARNAEGQLLGVAGFKTSDGALVGGTLRDLARVYGWAGAVWRGLVLSMFERDVEPGVLLMDGIFVTKAARGQGVGSALLDAILAHGRVQGLHSVRLDVIDTNPRAQALYERKGFVAGPVTHLGPLRKVFGFSSSVEMRANLDANT